MIAVGYARVSTEGQVKEGASLEAQQAKITAWCIANGYELGSFHVDAGISGARARNRPALQAAITAACKQKAPLIVYALSRFARSTKDAITISEQLAKAGADLVSLTEKLDTTTAAGKMMFRMMAVLAEFERDQIGERTREVLQHLRSQGRRISRFVPFGFDLTADGRSVVQNEREQTGLRMMEDLRLQGISLRKIAVRLTEEDIPPKTGLRWTAQAINMIIKRNCALKQRKVA